MRATNVVGCFIWKMNSRFTIDGSDVLENHLTQTCQRVATGVRKIIPNGELEALLLGGGYGRGQGGVLKTDSGDQPYNDLEFYVCLQGSELLNRRKYRRAIHHLAEKLSPEAGLEVEFKITSLDKLRKNPPTMFSYDLACGHRSFLGDDNSFAKNSAPNAESIPQCEATRLLMNRCSGLLFAKEHLQRKPFTEQDADFVGRNHAKAQLAFGDVILTAHGQYHWDCRERNRRLAHFSSQALPWINEVRRHHDIGLQFKLYPQRSRDSMDVLCERQRALTDLGLKIWLWLESTRLKRTFTSARNYAFDTCDKCPETNSLRNLLINARTFGIAILFESNPLRYPRQRLLHALALLLWEPTALTKPSLWQRLQTELSTNAVQFPELVKAYEFLWKQFN